MRKLLEETPADISYITDPRGKPAFAGCVITPEIGTAARKPPSGARTCYGRFTRLTRA